MSAETTVWVTAFVSILIGAIVAFLGLAAIEAGYGGYGHGSVPMVPVPRDNGLIAIGIAMFIIGVALITAALETIGGA